MRKFGMAVAAVLATVVAACGGSDEPASKASSGGGGKLEGSISVWIMDPGSPKIQGVVNQYGKDFEAANPGTKVDIQFVPWAQAHDKFVTAIAGGKVPDVAEMGTTWTPEFADQGALLEQPGIGEGGEYVSSLVDAATLNEKVYGKPWYAGARSLIYRKDFLEQAGVEPPKTWDDVMAAAKAVKEKVKGVYGIGTTGLSEHMYLPTIWQAGGEIATQEGDAWKSALNSPQAAEAIDWYASFYKEGLAPKAAIGWEEPDAQTAFINGDVAMLIAGGWGYNSIIATKPELEEKIGTELTPTGPSGKGTAFAGGSHLVQFTESGNHDLGAAFVDFMLQPDQLNKFTNEIGFLPGTTAGIEASGYLEDEVRKPFAEQLLNASAVYPPSPKWGGLEGANIFDGQIQKVMKGEETAQDAVAELATKMDEEFAG
jgi:N,N'-diacetylchitobiose transport system substrate-binding protein